jgi:hypothetical protein
MVTGAITMAATLSACLAFDPDANLLDDRAYDLVMNSPQTQK